MCFSYTVLLGPREPTELVLRKTLNWELSNCSKEESTGSAPVMAAIYELCFSSHWFAQWVLYFTQLWQKQGLSFASEIFFFVSCCSFWQCWYWGHRVCFVYSLWWFFLDAWVGPSIYRLTGGASVTLTRFSDSADKLLFQKLRGASSHNIWRFLIFSVHSVLLIYFICTKRHYMDLCVYCTYNHHVCFGSLKE